eukprot:5579598-Karenia_brevis.AAC.1
MLVPRSALPVLAISAAAPGTDANAADAARAEAAVVNTPTALTGTDPLKDDQPLKDTKFACLTAPGPTGTRAEHAKECMGIKQRPLANRLARAML